MGCKGYWVKFAAGAILILSPVFLLAADPPSGSPPAPRIPRVRELSWEIIHNLRLASIGQINCVIREFDNARGGSGSGAPLRASEALQVPGEPDVTLTPKDFEDEILKLFETAPKLRDINAFRTRWELTEEETYDALTYYSLHVFNSLDLIYDRPDHVRALDRLRVLSRAFFISLSNHPTARRRAFYERSLTHLSVPQMADQLGISEAMVYHDLGLLEFSIVEAFDRKIIPDETLAARTRLTTIHPALMSRAESLVQSDTSIFQNATRLRDAGLTSAQIAAVLEIGDQAIEFIFHHRGVTPRGVDWDRLINFREQFQPEVQILVTLRSEGLTYAEIAAELNHLFGTPQGTPNMRTEASVSAKLIALGFTNPHTLGDPNVFDPRYGSLKQNGELVLPTVFRFVADHYNRSDEWIAEQLSVTVEGLRGFFKRHQIVRTARAEGGFAVRVQDTSEKTNGLLELYPRQIEGCDKVLDFYEKHGAIRARNFGLGDQNVGITYDRFFNLFPDVQQAWLAVRTRARSIGKKFYITEIEHRGTANLSADFKEALRIDAAHKILDNWKGKPPDNVELMDLGLVPNRLFSSGKDYRQESDNKPLGIFDSSQTGWLFIREQASARGILLNLCDVRVQGALSDEYRSVLRDDALERAMDFIEKNRRLPNKDDFNREIVWHSKFFGVEGGQTIFSDFNEGWLAIRQRMQKRGLFIPLTHIVLKDVPNDLLAHAIRDDAIEDIVRLMLLKKRAITYEDFGDDAEQIKPSRQKLFGYYSYGQGPKSAEKRSYAIFPDPDTGWDAIITAVQTDERFSPKKGFPFELREKIIADLQAEKAKTPP